MTLPTVMRAVIKPEAASGLEMALLDLPTTGPSEVLIKVRAASICGTDLHIFNRDPWAQGRIHPPPIVGHEFCGDVVAVGDCGKPGIRCGACCAAV